MNKKILYIGWIGYRNLGDDLMWNSFYSLVKKYFTSKPITVIPSFPSVNIQELEPYDTVVLGGGSLISPAYIQLLHKAIKMKKKVVIWGSGIDRIPETVLQAIQQGKKTSAIQRFKGEEIRQLREVLLKADFVGVRGPYTKKVLEVLTGVETVPIIGDPGLLLTHSTIGAKTKKQIGINWGTTGNNLYGTNEKRLEKDLVQAAKKLIAKGYQIFIYAVWDKDFPSCWRLYKQIDDSENVIFEEKLYTEEELMKKLSNCLLTINFKLHPNLLSLSAGVPAIALGYRFKVFDLFSSLDLEHLVLSTSEEQIDEKIAQFVDTVIHEEENIKETYQGKQDVYQPLIEKAFIECFLW